MTGLEANLTAQDAAVAAGDPERFIELDDEFHRGLMEAAGRGRAWREVSTAKVHMDRVRRLSLPRPNTLARLAAEHREIVTRLRTGETTRAIEALHGHLTTVFSDIEQIRQDHPDIFVDHEDARPVRTVSTRLGGPEAVSPRR